MGALDRTRPYGQVTGTAGHVYEQDGKKFDGEGNEIGGLRSPMPLPDNVEIPVVIAKDGEALSAEPDLPDMMDNFDLEPEPEKIVTPKTEKKKGRPPKK